jgi:hypothetical protein
VSTKSPSTAGAILNKATELDGKEKVNGAGGRPAPPGTSSPQSSGNSVPNIPSSPPTSSFSTPSTPADSLERRAVEALISGGGYAPHGLGSLLSAIPGQVPSTMASELQVPWALEASWADTAPGTTNSFIQAYGQWVADNYQNYNADLYLCNWFPLRLLVEFASTNNLRVRLRHWPGQAPTTGGARWWDTTTIRVFDSHSGEFASADTFYTAVKSKVTARMIGELNTAPITRVETRAGDLVLYDYSPSYWHVDLIVAASATELVRQSGSTPAERPQDRTRQSADTPAGAYGSSPRRWDFAQFDTD